MRALSIASPCSRQHLFMQSPSARRPSTLLGMAQTQGNGWVERQPVGIYFFAASHAIAVFAIIKAHQCRIDLRQTHMPPPLGFIRHGLLLHGIHARQAALLGLVKLYRRSVFVRIIQHVAQLIAHAEQGTAHCFIVRCI